MPKEILADGRGVLVPFEDPDSIANAAIRLLDNDAERHAMRKRAYLHSRNTTWQNTAEAYMASFQRARVERMLRPRAALQDIFTPKTTDKFPLLNVSHSLSMTDDTGMLQRGDSWMFGPEADYERTGEVRDAVFPCGQTIRDDGDTIHLCYRAADSCMAMATGSIRTLLTWLDTHSSVGDGNGIQNTRRGNKFHLV